MPSKGYACCFCKRTLRSPSGLRLHLQKDPKCQARWKANWSANKNKTQVSTSSKDSIDDATEGCRSMAEEQHTMEDDPSDGTPGSEQLLRFIEQYPRPVAEILDEGLTVFEQWYSQNKAAGHCKWAPFACEEEWELARWLMKNAGHNQIDEFLKLDIIRSRCKLASKSKYLFLKTIDKLPTASPWICEEILVKGDCLGDDGKPMQEQVELWRRNPVDCIRELISNPAFSGVMAYAPERVWADKDKKTRIWDEMWTADWWWDTQKKLPDGATLAPVILASDKTKLSQFRGDQVAWPVYLSIGNIEKETRRKVSARATILIGYIPVSKLECCKESMRSLVGYRLYHRCMSQILAPLVAAGRDGVLMTCADGLIRNIFPIVAAFVCDHPEQCLITGVKENNCPRGKVKPDDRGEPGECLLRNVEETLKTLSQHQEGRTCPDFDAYGLRAIYDPFWKRLPHCDIFSCITPDILHQLLKGVFKDHLVKWITAIVGEEELDERFKAMTDYPGLRHFNKGISQVSQLTGREYKEMQKVFIPLIIGAVSARVLKIAQALLDFAYLAQLQLHTSATLAALRTTLTIFHDNKDALVELGVRKHFNIPKVHSMMHYAEAIESRGSADNFNTELPERLHIDYAKEAYRAGNHRDYIAHMTTWLQRQEAVDIRSEFLRWSVERDKRKSDPDDTDTGSSYDSDEGTDSESEQDNMTCEQTNVIGHLPARIPPFKVAKRSPFPRTRITELVQSHTASEFLPAFMTFVKDFLPNCHIIPRDIDKFDVFKQVQIIRPRNHFVSDRLNYDRVRAIPTIPASGRKADIPAHFDTALIIEHPSEFDQTASIHGLRVGQIKVIFRLPPQFGPFEHPLVYIEWFTPFVRIDSSVTRIYRLCHLAARNGPELDGTWDMHNVLDLAAELFVNPYISVDMFSSVGMYAKLA